MKLGSLLTLAVLLWNSASASTILFNFGSAAYDGTNSPGHVNGAATGTIWNTLATDTAAGILDSQGNTTSLAINFGTTSSNSSANANYTVVDYNAVTRNAPYSLTVASPLFSTPLGTDNSVRDVGNGIGLSLSGLAPGQYTFYVTAFRGDGNQGRVYDLYAGTSSDPITNFSGLSIGSLNNSNLDTWTAGNNYLTGTFTIDSVNDTFSLLSNSNSYIGVLNSLEIVAIPEPSLLLTSALTPLLLAFRRRL